jgi:hypothetical protein
MTTPSRIEPEPGTSARPVTDAAAVAAGAALGHLVDIQSSGTRRCPGRCRWPRRAPDHPEDHRRGSTSLHLDAARALRPIAHGVPPRRTRRARRRADEAATLPVPPAPVELAPDAESKAEQLRGALVQMGTGSTRNPGRPRPRCPRGARGRSGGHRCGLQPRASSPRCVSEGISSSMKGLRAPVRGERKHQPAPRAGKHARDAARARPRRRLASSSPRRPRLPFRPTRRCGGTSARPANGANPGRPCRPLHWPPSRPPRRRCDRCRC